MLVNIVGAPCSGKTTVAAMAFAALKEQGIPCEFIPEQARWHIAKKRFEHGLQPNQELVLNDDDQLVIMETQSDLEHMVCSAVGPDVVVITDSSVLLSLLYLSPEAIDSFFVKFLVSESIARTEMTFYSHVVPHPTTPDPNRIHTAEQSNLIESRIYPIFSQYAPEVAQDMIPLLGSADIRCKTVVGHILEALIPKS